MSKPEDIPQDVWDVALAIAGQWFTSDAYQVGVALDMARAILAAKAEEREACAVQAEAERLTGTIPNGTTVEEIAMMAAMVDVTSKSISAAIRKLGEG